MHIQYIAVVLCISVLSSCASVTQLPLPTEALQPIPIPTFTDVPVITSTPENILSLSPTTNPNLGTPLPDWKDVPVMPGAIKGEVKGFGYMYWVNATAEEVQTFYTEQMGLNEWPLVKHTDVLSWYGRGELLQFKQDYSNEFVDVIFVVSTEDNSVMIAIKKYIYYP